MTKLPFVSVIVPVFSGDEHLENCIAALQNQTYPRDFYEILIIDNENTKDLTKQLPSSQHVRVLTERVPSSYAARNCGIQAAKGEVIAFTDVDCIPVPDWLTRGVEALRSDPAIGFVGGHIEVFTLSTQKSLVELFETFEAFNQKKYINEWGFAATANLFTRIQLFHQIGLFDPKLKSSGDRDWGNRAVQAGHRGEYSPLAVVRHAARRSFRDFFRKCARVQGGFYDLRKREQGTTSTKLFIELWDGWPNRKDLAKLFRNKQYGAIVKGKLAFMYILYKGFRAIELARLLRGGASRRI